MNNYDLIAKQRLAILRQVEAATTEQLNLADFMDESNCDSDQLAQIKAYKADAEAQGGLVTQAQCNAVLGVSSGRAAQLVKAGTLKSYEHFGVKLISVNQLIEYAKLQKISGNLGATLLRAFKNS